MLCSLLTRLFVLALAATGASGCGHHRLGSSAACDNGGAAEDRPARKLGAAVIVDDGQPPCGSQTPAVDQRLEIAKSMSTWRKSGRRLEATKNYTVPVYFWHTYVPGSPAEQILTYETIEIVHFAALQYGFRDTPFKFELKGIQIVASDRYGRCARLDQSEYDMKRELRVPGKTVLNIYICDSAASDARAWSSFPIMADTDPLYDGVVLRNSATVPAAKVPTAVMNIVHETGHWLGLMHTFEGGCTPKVYNNIDGIQIRGDDVDDTPAHAGPTSDVTPGANVCWLFDPPLDTCKTLSNGADVGPDPVKNYMNYVDGACLRSAGEFTPGQVERMVAQYATFRLDAVCRPAEVTCVNATQCCPGLTCIGGNDSKKKCK